MIGRRYQSFAAALTALSVVLTGGMSPARAVEQGASEAAREQVMGLVADSLARNLTIALACDAEVPAGMEEAWRSATGGFAASLSAAGFDDGFIGGVETKLDAAWAPGAEGECGDDLRAYAALSLDRDWAASAQRAIVGLGLVWIATPPTREQVAEVEAVFAREVPQQKRVFECMALVDGDSLPAAAKHWDEMVVEVAGWMTAAGIRPGTVLGLAQGAVAGALLPGQLQAVTGEDLTACIEDQSWQQRWYGFAMGALADETERILGVVP